MLWVGTLGFLLVHPYIRWGNLSHATCQSRLLGNPVKTSDIICVCVLCGWTYGCSLTHKTHPNTVCKPPHGNSTPLIIIFSITSHKCLIMFDSGAFWGQVLDESLWSGSMYCTAGGPMSLGCIGTMGYDFIWFGWMVVSSFIHMNVEIHGRTLTRSFMIDTINLNGQWF